MSQYRTTAELLDNILRRAGEVTNGNSSYEQDALAFLNKVHRSIVNGATVFNKRVDEYWPWAQARHPLVLELVPKISTGTVQVANGSQAIAFSAAPAISVGGWFLKLEGRSDWLRIASHAAASANAALDSKYHGASGTLNYKVVKLDYDLVPEYIAIDSQNDKLDFQETDGTQLTATLTHGVYTPAALATEVATQLDAAGADTYTVTYDPGTRRFTIATNDNSTGFKIQAGSGTNGHRSAWGTLGFDDKDYTFVTSSVTGSYDIIQISRLPQAIDVHKGNSYGEDSGKIYQLSADVMSNKFPLKTVQEGVPNHFAVVRQHRGRITIRFDRYPVEATRIVVPYIPLPRNLQDSANSVPLVPPNHEDVLEYGAAAMILQLKNDDKSSGYASIAGEELDTMMVNNRKTLDTSGAHYGAIIPRPEQMGTLGRRTLQLGGKD